MNQKTRARRFFPIVVALTLSAACYVSPVTPAQVVVQEDGDRPEPAVAVGDDVVVTDGQVVRGDTVALGGNVIVEAGGVVEGNVVAMDGDIWVDGTVQENALSFGGVVSIGEDGVVNGQTFMLGRRGIRMLPFHIQSVRDAVRERPGHIIAASVSAVVVGALAALLAMLTPTPLEHVRRAIVDAPIISGVIGLLSLVVGSLASTIMTVTCIFIPLAIIIGALFAIGMFMGWAALGILVGNMFLRVAGVDTNRFPWTAALLGAMVLTFAVRITGILPGGNAISAALGTLALSVGLGAVALTRFGSRAHE